MQGLNSSNVRIVDISGNNGTVDFNALVNASIKGVWCKATEGATYRDPTFPAFYKSAKDHELLRGAYCFARPRTSTAMDEANAFVDYVNQNGGFDGLPPVLDMEDAGGLSPYALYVWVDTWMSRVKALTGKQPVLYTYTSFIEQYMGNYFSKYPLWIAQYSGGSAPPNVGGFTEWMFYQFTESMNIGGKLFDCSEFAGDINALKAFCEGGNNVLTIGSQGEQVLKLQKDLKFVLNLPDTFALDSDFGPATATAVKSFKIQFNLQPIDGIADDNMLKALAKAVDDKSNPTYPTAKIKMNGKDSYDGIDINNTTYINIKSLQDLGFTTTEQPVDYKGEKFVTWATIGHNVKPSFFAGGVNFVFDVPLQTELDDVKKQVADLQAQLAKAQSDVQTAQSEISSLKAKMTQATQILSN